MNDQPHAQRETPAGERCGPAGRSPVALNHRDTEAQRNRKNVITRLDPVIHGTARANGAMYARVKPAHDSFFSFASVVQGDRLAAAHAPGGLSGERAKPSDQPHVRRAFARRSASAKPPAGPGGLRPPAGGGAAETRRESRVSPRGR